MQFTARPTPEPLRPRAIGMTVHTPYGDGTLQELTPTHALVRLHSNDTCAILPQHEVTS